MAHPKELTAPHFLALLLPLLLLLLHHPAKAQLPPVISNFPNSDIKRHVKELLPGSSHRFSLQCNGRGQPEPKYMWFLNDAPLMPQGNGLVLSDNNETLAFMEPSLEHHGYYHCEAWNKWGRAKSEVILVTDSVPKHPEWAVPPEFTESPKTEIPQHGSQVTFTCQAKGEPEPKIIWTKNGKVLEENTDRNELVIPEVGPKDVGTYACNASNLAGYNYKVVYLNILTQLPYFLERPRDKTVSIGQELIMRCSAKGYPKPTITWGYGNTDNDSYELTESNDLRINRVVEKDAGAFECIASNEQGSSTAVGNIKVVSTTTIEDGPVDTEAQIHSTVKMNCLVLWDPNFELTVLWKKDNVDIDSDSDRIHVEGDNALVIEDLGFQDAGTYTCVASTPSTGTSTASGTLTVTGIPPFLIEGPSAMTVAEGTTVRVLCKVDGYPKPTQTWFKNVNRIKPDDAPRITEDSEGSLIMRDARLDDSAKYVCRAENGNGEPVVVSAFIDVRMKSKVIKGPDDFLFQEGDNFTFDCDIQVDPALEESSVLEWFKDEVKLNIEDMESLSDEGNNPTTRLMLHDNNSLTLFQVVPEDVGHYSCHLQTGLDEVVLVASLYREGDGTWLIVIILVLICLLLLALCTLCFCCMRKKAKRKGQYGVKDFEEGKKGPHNKSDIHYSVNDEVDGDVGRQTTLPDAEAEKVSIFQPEKDKSGPETGLPDVDFSGSENSLLNGTDEEDWLKKGFDEDGSFREGKYAA